MLHDLDELVLHCRDERAKSYIREAVACYRSGAYRSAIVATWIAVAFDLIDKFRELALSGDKEALSQVEAFDAMRAQNDIPRSLTFERSLLDVAKDRFELISPVEHIDLSRLQEDRNRCAHPSMASENEVFSPSAELARVHIRSAVEHLLRHEPSQGKAALTRLVDEVRSPYFPMKLADVRAVLASSPLKRGRTSLVRNFLIVVVKDLLDPATDVRQVAQLNQVFAVIKEMHLGVWRETVRSDLSKLVHPITSADGLARATDLVALDEEVWIALAEAEKVRLKYFITHLPTEQVGHLFWWLNEPMLRDTAIVRAKRLTYAELDEWLYLFLPADPVIRETVIARYLTVKNYDSANSWGRLLSQMADSFTSDEIVAIVTAAKENYEIRGSFQWVHLANELKANKAMADEDFDKLMAESGFEEFMRATT
ncbi:hypothetical protein C8K18_10531 [Paraburkholderia sp. GV068]|uniref:hypothetical protein n=1 Tax=unclassified Paraburkholderia TaxID=2615204 RepID=UPI000D31DDDE|nr:MULTISPECIES: hypothetical protein [unclassified Paraburkholderia]PTR00268.1 hypothetical protein C8K19_10531 [Paraburkholderia sp. GV072]PUB05116.1 hypothetical protein C8K18_10531 [Paraburkholderia sp. GV068]